MNGDTLLRVGGSGTLLSTLLAFSAMMLALSIVLQIVQEIFKYLRSSRSGVYRKVLRDAFGSWIDQIATPQSKLPLARGPFQFFRTEPGKVLLPQSKASLLQAIDDLAPDWIGVMQRALEEEVKIQGAEPARPSPALERTLQRLADVKDQNETSHWNARSMLDFFDRWMDYDAGVDRASHERVFDAQRMLGALERQFLPQREQVVKNYDQVQENFHYTWGRHNLRLTFVLGFLLAALFYFPFDLLWLRATSLNPAQAAELAESVIDIQDEFDELRNRACCVGDARGQRQNGRAASEQDATESPAEAAEATDEEGGPSQSGEDAAQADDGPDAPPPAGEALEEETSSAADSGAKSEQEQREEIEQRLATLQSLQDRALVAASGFEGKPGCRVRLALRCALYRDCRQNCVSSAAGSIGHSPPSQPDGTGPTPERDPWAIAVNLLRYLLHCLLTALLLSFGAPFWDRATKSLLRASNRGERAEGTAGSQEEVARA